MIRNSIFSFAFIPAFILCITCGAVEAGAQNRGYGYGEGRGQSADDAPAGEEESKGDDYGSGAPMDVIDLKIKKDEYVDPSHENLSKLMWALGAVSVKNDEAVDNYLRINECDVYKRFFHNDIEWEKIREATKNYINQKVGLFPMKFEVVVPIYLGRYNADRSFFELEEQSKMHGLRRLNIFSNSEKSVCGKRNVQVKSYPRDMILTLNRPFSFTRVPVDRSIAELYIEDVRTNLDGYNDSVKLNNHQRVAFMRAKVRITSFKEYVTLAQGRINAVLFGQLDGIEVYADMERQKLLYREDKNVTGRPVSQGNGFSMKGAGEKGKSTDTIRSRNSAASEEEPIE